jgi:hypothetical protein
MSIIPVDLEHISPLYSLLAAEINRKVMRTTDVGMRLFKLCVGIKIKESSAFIAAMFYRTHKRTVSKRNPSTFYLYTLVIIGFFDFVHSLVKMICFCS